MTIIPFSGLSGWQAQMTIDGTSYLATALWNTYAQRWYIQLTTSAGTLIQDTPLIGSSLTFDIPLFPGLFTNQVVYREDSSQFEIS